jgi:hypothetical protein
MGIVFNLAEFSHGLLKFCRSVGDHGCACESVVFEPAEITRKRAVFCEDICKMFPANEQAELVVRLSEEGQRGAKIAKARDYH